MLGLEIELQDLKVDQEENQHGVSHRFLHHTPHPQCHFHVGLGCFMLDGGSG